MTAPSTAVKHFRYNGHPSAPVLSGTAGTLIGVLDACLVNGYGSCTLNSLVVADGIATATVSTGHSFPADVVLLIAGATPSGLNGEKRPLARTTTTFSFDATGISDQTATGTITAKIAPAGWEKVYSGTNLAVYRSADVTGTRCYLSVDDTGAQVARVVGYESMTDVNTGTGPFPNATQQSGGLYWGKANSTAATARGWEVFADSRTFYLHVATSVTTNIEGGSIFTFGDFNSQKSGDAYGCAILGWITDRSTSGIPEATNLTLMRLNATAAGFYAPRSCNALGGPVLLNKRQFGLGVPDSAYSGASPFGYPSPPSNALLVDRIALVENSAVIFRGMLRGVYFVPQNCISAITGGTSLDAQGDLIGRKLAAVKEGYPTSTGAVGLVLIDITGPWT